MTKEWRNHFERFEGNCSHFYLDGEGIVTIGIGCVVFEPSILPMLRRSDNVPAGIVELTEEYRAVKGMENGHRVDYYGNVCKLYLPDVEIEKLFNQRLSTFISGIEDSVTTLEDYPEPAALALIDMAFNLGMKGLTHKFPKFMTAFMAKDWAICARECFRVGIQPDRNDWTRRTFEGLVS